EVRKHGSDHDRRKPPAIPPTKHRDGLHAHLNGFGASRAVRFAYAPPGLGLSHRDVSAGPRKESNCWPATGGTHDSPGAPCVASLERLPLGATRGEWPPSTRCERPHRRPSDRRAPEGVLEAGEEVGGHRDPSRPLGRRLLPAAPGGEPETADGAPMPVGRLPAETPPLEEADLGGEAGHERGPLAVDRALARAGPPERPRGR